MSGDSSLPVVRHESETHTLGSLPPELDPVSTSPPSCAPLVDFSTAVVASPLVADPVVVVAIGSSDGPVSPRPSAPAFGYTTTWAKGGAQAGWLADHSTAGTMNAPSRHISLPVPQPGSTGRVAARVSYVHVTRTRSPGPRRIGSA